MKISAVVVTFNRKKLLLECLNALRNQTYPLDAIFIIDGPSTDGTPEALLECGYIKELPPKKGNWSWETKNVIYSPINNKPIKVYYVRLYKDVGGSGGFYEGVKRAYEEGYNWIWLMDDDAEPREDALEKLIRYMNLPGVIALAPTVIRPTGEISKPHRGILCFKKIFPMIQIPLDESKYKSNQPVQIDFVSFVGPLIKRDAIKIVGFPKKEFFIHHDDVEYSIRLRTVGKIYLIPDSVIIHKENIKKTSLIKKRFLGKTIYRIPYNKLWKTYYGTRNLTYLGRIYSKSKFKFYFKLLKRWAVSVGAIILFDDHKIKRIQFITSAYLDGLRGKFDNEKPKRILYGGKKE
ncbi:glycosyltransferase family 2 protein [Pyrococcus horikoshii]|uniref:Glycosyltransferase 2-like domain-containing protein n=2 Tax=Pyrococcus horikoshii TaxID=53953 RepID=O58161_PYRHO|nr:glycosyltransferase family 2 protein [Pyrococcus horikoshii]BAA29510.1 348aa long hypothetical protein [Pyrococcus horikoshii OT3]HII60989.1 glycosyltransferase [Pyrococcus horikoshii]